MLHSFVVLLLLLQNSFSDCSDPVLQLCTFHGQNCNPLKNNSAVGQSNKVRCLVPTCANTTYNVQWIDNAGKNLTKDEGTAVHWESNGNKHDLLIPNGINNGHKGIYSCKVQSTHGDDILLSVGVYASAIGSSPSIFPITLTTSQFYPFAALLSVTTDTYPPTFINWTKDGNKINNSCGYSTYQIIKIRKDSEYKNVLSMNRMEGCSYDGVYECSIGTNGTEFNAVNITLGKANPPRNLTLLSISHNQIHLSWLSPQSGPSILKYCVYFKNASLCTETLHITMSVSVNNSYTIVVLSVAAVSQTLPSDPESFDIHITSPETSPNITQLIALNSTSILFNWTTFDGAVPIMNFTINITNNCSTEIELLYITNYNFLMTEFSHVLVDLQPVVEYCLQLVSINPWGVSNPSDVECIIMPGTNTSAPSISPAISNITLCGITQLTWSEIPCNFQNGPLDHYSIHLYNSTTCSGTYNSFKSKDLLFTFDNLRPYTNYCISIAQVNIGNLTGPYSSGYNILTPESASSPPDHFEVTNITIKTVRLQWAVPSALNGKLQGYRLVYWRTIGSLNEYLPIETERLSWIVNGLYPNQEYVFNLTAINGVGYGNETVVTATTNPIDKVTGVVISSLKDSLLVRWNRSISNDIDLYLISYRIGNQLMDNTSVAMDTTSVSIPTNETGRYTISLSAAVIISGGKIIIGDANTLYGCHGDCDATVYYLWYYVGGSLGGASLMLILIFCLFGVCFYRYKQRRTVTNSNGNMLEMFVVSGTAPCVTSELKDQHVQEGEDVVIQVIATGSPEIIWYTNGQIIADDKHFELDEDNGSTLIIHDVKMTHAGVYEFTATNSLGSVKGQMRVFVKQEKGPPVDEVVPSKESLNSESVLQLVYLSQLAGYVSDLINNCNGGFKRQFQSLKTFNYLEIQSGLSPENKRRNRFNTIIPYDNNRVILTPIEGRGDCTGSYINASYISGHSRSKQFIATQGPLPHTLVDFWRLIWQEEVKCIVMLLGELTEGGVIRCQQYWPDNGTAYYGPYKVTIESQEDCIVYKERRLTISLIDSSIKSTRYIYHVQFTGWPEYGMPDSVSPFLSLCHELERCPDSDHQILVHCSAGVGRTGVLLSTLIGIQQGKQEGCIDFIGIVNNLRKQRMNIIQTEEQYAFVHRAVLEGLYCRQTNLIADDLSKVVKKLETQRQDINMTSYEAQFKVLEVLSPKPKNVSRNVAIKNSTLARSHNYLPSDDHRVVLQKQQNEESRFIHASFLDGYKQAKVFIIAESPINSTAHLFWRMTFEQKCAMIIMLCDCGESGENTCYPYWPATVDSEKDVGEYRITNTSHHFESNYTELKLTVTDNQSQEIHTVVQLQIPQWAASGQCSNPESIIAAISRVEVIQRKTGNKPILVHCSDTVTRTGVFCTLYTAIQQYKTEQQVDVYQILKTLRTQKPGLVPKVELYQMIHKLLARYFETEFVAYKNFSQCFD